MISEKKLKSTGVKKNINKHIATEEEIKSDIKLTLKKTNETNNIIDNINDKSNEKTKSNNWEFQISDWNSYHEIDGDDEEKYIIQLFGRTEDDKDVCLKVTGFTPFFYVEVPLSWEKKHMDKFVNILKNKVSYCTNNNPNYNYDLSNSLVRHVLVQKHKFYNFANKKLFKFVMLVFKNHTAMREFANILARPLKAFGLTKEPMLYQRYESNIEPHIRFMHINNLSSCGWVSIDKTKLNEDKKYSYCDHSYRVNWKDVKPSENDDRMALFKIMGYDIECVSCDHNFPQAERETDKIIQIGITMYRYGSMNCYEQHILTLKECVEIKNANVECYKTEKGLIRGWAKKIRDIRPDFKAGYNNFGFDDKYIYDRIARIDREEANRQEINVEVLENKFMDEIFKIIGKVNNEYLMENEGLLKSLTYFEVKNLSSSALGDNELKFIQVPGILSVDMMKIIQRDHRLVGYKLDNVSANFITEGVNKIVEPNNPENGKNNNSHPRIIISSTHNSGQVNINIYTRSTKALEKDSYIQIMVDDGYSSTPLCEGGKYKVFDIETVTEKKYNEKEKKEETFVFQCIKTAIGQKDITDLKEILLNPLLKVYWTFAKDDMHHTLINKYFKEGNPKRIGKIAKYCIKDCKLVNLLMAKLEIIVNSVGMAKVCHVPLSYLFLRGQGVKIFSLVSKKCREKNFLIPVLRRKKKDSDGDDDETYEGATVITPKPGVYLSPISVLDYSSLYPNSMRERNLSQECYVNDPKYDNLPGYIYHDINIVLKDNKGKIIRNIDGTPQKEHHRFAQELISDDQMNEELKDILEKINNSTASNIEKIKLQKYYTDDNRNTKLTDTKAKIEKKMKEIKENKDLSEKEKNKIIETETKKLNSSIAVLIDHDKKIKDAKELSDKKLKDISENKNITDDEKTRIIDAEKEKLKIVIKEITEEIELNDEDKEYFINIEKEKAKKKISDEKAKKYNIVNGQTVKYGILPEILTELLNKRKETNGRLADEKDPFVKAILNALQLAFKVTANSLYGQTGAATSPIYFIAIAASTTAIGRERLHYAKKIVEENFPGSEVIYGDSVTGDTPIIYRDVNKDINITTIEELGNFWEPYDQFKAGDSNRKFKQQAVVNYEVWTTNSWSKIRRVIRHKTQKKIYRIFTSRGVIDVTEDHSLLDHNHCIIKPSQCTIGTELLVAQNLNREFVSNNNSIIGSVKKLHEFLDPSKGYCAKGKLNAQNLFYLMNCAGYQNIVIKKIENDEYYFDTMDGNINMSAKIIEIKNLYENNFDDYVYDLETEDGTFHAGVGELIIKNTDSIFINFHIKDADGNELTDKEALIKSIDLAQKAAKLINDQVPKPQGIVYEKTLHPFILVAKKKYVGLLFEKNPEKYYLKSMGIVLKRRDNAPIVKIVVGGIIDHILKNRDIDKAVEYTKEVIRKLMDGKYSIDKFIISKTLKARYKKPSTIAHKVLADRMAERDPGNKPQINDRIPFVYIVKDMGKKKKKDILQGDLIEHPDYVTKNGLQIDYLYYMEHQIINPATQILELMMSTKAVGKLFNEFIIEEENKRKRRQSMEKWMDFSTIENDVNDENNNENNKSIHSDKFNKSIHSDKSDKSNGSDKTNKNTGSKTTKAPLKSLKKIEPQKKDDKYANLPFVGKTKRHECQNMNKWMNNTNNNNHTNNNHTNNNNPSGSDDWEPSFD